MKKFLNMYVGSVRVATFVAAILLALMAVGVFLPWYDGESLFGLILAGFGMSGTMSALAQKLDFSAMSTWFTAIFAILAALAAGSLLFGVRAVVTSFGDKIKGLTPAGVFMSVLALAGFAVVVLLGGVGNVQVGLWLCLVSGICMAVWGIFN